jgi:hypothetical protein
MDILPGLFCEDEVVARFKSSGLNLRTLRRCARAKGVGRKFSRHWFFTEPEILELMKGAKATCSNSQNGGARQASTRAGHTSASAFSKALELATERLLATLQNGIFERQARGGVQPVEGFVGAASRYMEGGGSAGLSPRCFAISETCR